MADFAGPAFAHAVLDAAPVIVVVLDAHGRVVHYNGFMERLCGRPIAEARGCDWFAEFLLDDERDSARAVFELVIGATPRGNINSVRAHDGTSRVIEWHNRMLEGPDQQASTVVAVGVDITERIREAHERADLGRLFALFDSSVDEVFFLLDPDRTRLLYVSSAIESVFGVERPAAYADMRALFEHMHPDDRSTLLATIARSIPSGGLALDSRVQTREGNTRWVVTRLRELGADSPMPGAIAAISIDITHRQMVEEQLRQLTEQLEARVEERTHSLELERARLADAQRIAEVGDWDWDVTTGALHWSDQVYQTFGVAIGEVVPTYAHFLSAIHPEDRAPVEAAIARAMASAVHYEIEHRIVRPDGGVRTVLESGEVERDAAGQAVRMHGTVQDITRQKQVEAQLRGSIDEKDALLHEIHHRVKNNLQVVASLLYLQGNNADPSARLLLDECRTRIQSMALIHEHLYMSGQLARIDMVGFLAKLADELSRVFCQTRRIEIRVIGGGLQLDIERAVPVALLANEVVTNALKYAYPLDHHVEAPEVRIVVGPDTIEISDDGVGFPSELDPAHASTLGIRLVHTLARQLGATLEFANHGGARIRVRLP